MGGWARHVGFIMMMLAGSPLLSLGMPLFACFSARVFSLASVRKVKPTRVSSSSLVASRRVESRGCWDVKLAVGPGARKAEVRSCHSSRT